MEYIVETISKATVYKKYSVEANNPEEAKEKFIQGEYEYLNTNYDEDYEEEEIDWIKPRY